MSISEDRRISRTKHAIRQAWVSLIEEKGLDSVSVKDITTKANINRGTFYLHYKDKMDLLYQTLKEITLDLEDIVLEMNDLSSDAITNTTMVSTVIIRLFGYFNTNAPLIKALLPVKGPNSLQAAIKEMMWRNIFEKNKMRHIKQENLQVPKEYLVSYIISAHIGVIQEWLEKEVRETPEEMAEILMNLTFRGPLYAAGLTP